MLNIFFGIIINWIKSRTNFLIFLFCSNSPDKLINGENNTVKKSPMEKTKKRKSTKQVKQATIPTSTNYNYKNLDEWLENSVKGIQLEQQQQQEVPLPASPFALGPMASTPWSRRTTDPWMFPSELNYLNLPGYTSPLHPNPFFHLMGNTNNHHHQHHEFASLPPVLNSSSQSATFGSTTTSNNINNNNGSSIGGNNNDKAALNNTDTANQNRM